MADLLTHVLVPYILLTAVRWRYSWPDERWVVVGMAGGAIPDLVKISIVLDEGVVESLLDLPFSYAPISTVGGVLVIAGTIAVFFAGRARRAFQYLVFGGFTALVLDGMRVFVDGHANFWVYPLWWRPPTPSLYVTSDPRVVALTVTLALAVFLFDRSRDEPARSG